ncbi:MAG: M20/M25/M40 family metallo-hydrolase, partial [Oscillospiraceae bacterium]
MNEIKEYIYSHREELLSVLASLVEIPSVKGEPAEGAPFGKEPRRALDKMLEICAGMGFATETTANAVGSADLSPNGEAALAILCHLDVVPAEPANWASDPYTLTERDGKLFGRGVIDDKGPAVAALFAMKCIKDLGIPLKKGVRLVFGTDEENGSEDIEMYLAQKS